MSDKKYIYLAGPVSGESKTSANAWRKLVSESLRTVNPGFVGVNPVRREPVKEKDGLYLKAGECDELMARQIAAKNRLDVERADVVLAYLPTLSTGTFIEIGWASAKGTPIIIVSPLKEILEHPVIMDCASWRFFYDKRYEGNGFMPAIRVIEELFEVYADD